mmetsp:Transcript_166164/g.403734  ORF Transcript_166164/g.403734 Transcript_166164/m.403734 type:complete len:225 (+) Transcript_166164:2-676(+)
MLTACDAYAVYSNVSAVQLLGPQRVASLHLSSDGVAVKGSMDVPKNLDFHTADNAPVFHQVWQQVFKEATYRRYDWTIKLDPDTVFLPDRLRGVLLTHQVGRFRELGQDHHISPFAAALGNGGRDCSDMLGAIMVINREAMAMMQELWHLVLQNNVKREDSMILVFMTRICKCDEPEPRLLLNRDCQLSPSVPCRERVAVHGMKSAKAMWEATAELSRCLLPTI